MRRDKGESSKREGTRVRGIELSTYARFTITATSFGDLTSGILLKTKGRMQIIQQSTIRIKIRIRKQGGFGGGDPKGSMKGGGQLGSMGSWSHSRERQRRAK